MMPSLEIGALSLTRRSFLGTTLSTALIHKAKADPQERIAVLDWAMLETLLALDVIPVAATELLQFRKIAIEPAVPPQVADLGLRGSPNFEMLRLSNPDLIVSSPWFTWANGNLERIAPIASYSIYEPGQPPYAFAEKVTKALGTHLRRTSQAGVYVEESARDLERVRQRLTSLTNRPIFLINLGDARHFRVFGPDSMFGDVLQRIGFRNAWPRPTSYGAAAPIPLEALAEVPKASIVIISPIPPDAQSTLARSPLWNALPAVREKRVMVLPPINPFGALPAALRFARLLMEALTEPGRFAHG